MMAALYVAIFIVPLIVDIFIGYDSYRCYHSVKKAMAWFSVGLLAQVLAGVYIF